MNEEQAMTLDFQTFREAVQRDAAIRRRARLQPVGGVGTKIYPSTYPKA